MTADAKTADGDADAQELRAREVWADLRRLLNEVRDPRAAVREAVGLSFVKAKALRLLELGGPLTLRELTEILATDPPYTTLIVDGLQDGGLAERRPHPTDRRAKQVYLTQEGHRLARRVIEVLSEPPPALVNLDPDDLAALQRILSLLLAPDVDLDTEIRP